MIRSSIMKQNKKAGFEMSITTIVVLVIAVVMLIMGLLLVRTIMCGSINLAASGIEGAQDEINKLFGEQRGEIACMGGAGKTYTIVPGKYNVVGCGFTPKVQTTYDVWFEPALAEDITGREIDVEGWLRESPETHKTVNASPRMTSYATFAIYPPETAPEGLIKMKAHVNGQTIEVRYEIRSIGWMKETVC